MRARFPPAAPAASPAGAPGQGRCAPGSGFGGTGNLRPEIARPLALLLPGHECQSQLSLFFTDDNKCFRIRSAVCMNHTARCDLREAPGAIQTWSMSSPFWQ